MGRFWDTARRNALLGELGLAIVPRLARGRLGVTAVTTLLGPSQLADGPMEGIVVRREADGWTRDRAKVVNSAFTQAMDTHWSKGALVQNELDHG